MNKYVKPNVVMSSYNFCECYVTQNGHYTSVIEKDNTWYHCNDNQIKETILNKEIMDAYILFYKF